MYPSPIPVRRRESLDHVPGPPCATSTPRLLKESAQTTFIGSQAVGSKQRPKTQKVVDSSVVQMSVVGAKHSTKRKFKWQEDLESSFQSSLFGAKPQQQLPNLL